VWFFVISALAAVPGIILLWWLQMRGHFRALGAAKVTAVDD
jgi:PAT family beta-lactamase induction signal transducer AmpG